MARLLITAGLFFAEAAITFATGGATAPIFSNPLALKNAEVV